MANDFVFAIQNAGARLDIKATGGVFEGITRMFVCLYVVHMWYIDS